MRLPERGYADRSGNGWPVGLGFCRTHLPVRPTGAIDSIGEIGTKCSRRLFEICVRPSYPCQGCWALVFPTSGDLNLNDRLPLGHGIPSGDLRPFFRNPKPVQPSRHISGTGKAVAPARKSEGFDRQPPPLECLPESGASLKTQCAMKHRPRHQRAIGLLQVVSKPVNR